MLVRARMMLAALAMALPGCATMPPPLGAESGSVAGYRLGPGDRLRVTVYNETALTGEYIVTPAGSVAFPLIGTVPVGNTTIEALETALTGRLADGYVNDPRVSVEILSFRPFYILGEVNRPGEYPYASGLTLGQAVAAAGGYTYRANRRQIFVRRADAAEHSVDLRGVAVRVLPGDTIRVGERYL